LAARSPVARVWLQRGSGIAVMTVVAVILTDRLRRSTARQRRVLGPLYLYGIAAVLFTPLAPDVIGPLSGLSSNVITAVQLGALIGVPIASAAGTLLGGFARTSEIQELGAWLGAMVSDRPSLTEAVAQTLGDESVQLAYWAASGEHYVDGSGSPLELPSAGSGRGVAAIELGERHIGAVIYDAVLIGDVELVGAAGRVIAIALDREWLTTELLASQDALRLSRARIVEAADRERRRIARNLHDGLQMQLVPLALEAQRLAGNPGAASETARAATTLRERIDAAAADLRELVHGVMPAPLIERGLEAATQDLVDRMPLPTDLELGVSGALPEHVASTAYFVVAEALANAVKHSGANSLSVRVGRDGDAVVVEVADDGIGGVVLGPGLGLRSLVDRVDALGGSLRIDSRPGQGTRVVAELPCG
jgi:signal transduction histidine kinase